ncbi:MAG: hypothetical protein V7L29_00480 [Nostoc sp.]|uniref:hypothetical protein n=1 Tax=Nostoc sp. TaxID=1180 RepID=UPI002FF55D23
MRRRVAVSGSQSSLPDAARSYSVPLAQPLAEKERRFPSIALAQRKAYGIASLQDANA